jgi:hypothetical protein
MYYYDENLRCYWCEDARGNFIKINERSLQLRLRDEGFSRDADRDEELSPLDRRILQIQQNHSVDYAAPLAGYSKGQYEIFGKRILVTESPILIEPRKGDWPMLAKVLTNLFGDQVVYFYGWVKHAVECLRQGKRAPGQALVIVGQHDSGKSLVQSLVTLLLGGRAAKPYRYMSGGTSFNGELFCAEHQMIEDEPASRDLRTRKKFGSEIKMMTACETQSCHAKNRQAITLTPLWRLTISLNDEPESLLTLPPLDNSLEDKVILCKGEKHAMPMLTSSLRDRDIFWQTLKNELPAFIDFLLNWEIPEHLKSERFGITHYHHPEIRKAIDTLAPEMRLLEIIDATIFVTKKADWIGSAAELENELALSVKAREANTLLDFGSAAGTYLGRLAISNPKRVEKQTTGGGNRWVIHPPRNGA